MQGSDGADDKGIQPPLPATRGRAWSPRAGRGDGGRLTLKQKRKSEFALIRRFPGEPCFGVRLAGTNPDEMAWAAALAEARGTDFVDSTSGARSFHFTRRGWARRWPVNPPAFAASSRAWRRRRRNRRLQSRFDWAGTTVLRNHVDLARAAVDGGAQAVFVHGRTRDARYRRAADWGAIGEVAAAVRCRSSATAICCFRMKSTTHV